LEVFLVDVSPVICYTIVSLFGEVAMRFAGIKELKHRTMDILKESEETDVIITAYGKPTAILHHITEEELADYLIENDPAFRNRIEEAFVEYSANGGITADALIKKLEKRRGVKKV
jgi:hypothetical protein